MENIGRNKGGLSSAALLVTCLGVAAAGYAAGAEDAGPEAAPFRVHVQAGEAGWGVRRALAGADRLLRDPRCEEVLTDFRDASHRTLKEVLDGSGVSARGYLRWIVFADGRDLKACRWTTLAVTSPGSRVVFICPTAFALVAMEHPEEAEAALIHEMLHTLGLGENPPSSREITARVRARCGSGAKTLLTESAASVPRP